MKWLKHCMCGQPTSSSTGRWSAGLFQVPGKKNRALNACNRAHQEKRLWKLPLSIENKGKQTISNQFIDDMFTSHPRPRAVRGKLGEGALPKAASAVTGIALGGLQKPRLVEQHGRWGILWMVAKFYISWKVIFPHWIGFQPSGWWCRISQPSTVSWGYNVDQVMISGQIYNMPLSLSENQYQFLYGILWERKWTRISRFWGNLFFDRPIKWRWTHIINSSKQFYTKKIKIVA